MRDLPSWNRPPLQATAGNGMTAPATSKAAFLGKRKSRIPYYLVLFYLLLEYGRPQDQLPFLSALHLPAVTIILLFLSLVLSGGIPMRGKQTFFFLLLLGLMVFHGPIAVNNYWALMIFIATAMNFIVFLALTRYVDDTEKYDKLVKIWLGVHVFLAVIGIWKKGRGIGGFLGDENDFCMTMNMIIPFTFFLSMNSSGKNRLVYIFFTCLFLFVIILTQSRGGFIGLIATGIYCWFRTKRKVLTAMIMGLLVVFAALMAPASYWKEVRSIEEEGTRKGTGAERIYTWGIGWHMFLDNPIMGVGQGNFPWVFKKYEREVTGSDEPYHGRSVAGRAAHSIYFTLLPELGLIGTMLFLGMAYTSIKDLKYILKATLEMNKINPKGPAIRQYYLALALEGSLIAYLVSGVFISILYYPNFWIYLGFVVSLKKIVVSYATPLPSVSSATKARRI